MIIIFFSFQQKSQSNEFQRKSYNLQKKRSLLKPMMFVSTTGYIISCIGPFFSDYSNNDASIMKNILGQNTEKILNWIKQVTIFIKTRLIRSFIVQDDILIVDRGFRDSINTMEDLGLNVILPSFLNGRRQFTSSEANESRHVTKLRWVVEAVNGRIKQFKFFSNTIQNSSLPFLEQYLLITCAMINRYQLPVKSNQQNDLEIAEKMAALKIQKKNFDSV